MKPLESNLVAMHVRQRLLVANHGGRLMTNGGRTEIIMMVRKQDPSALWCTKILSRNSR